jgi:hypothetical protein
VIVVGGCTTGARFDEIARPAIEASAEPGTVVIVQRDARSIFEGYNTILNEAQALRPEAVVLIHDDTRVQDVRFCEKIRAAFEDPSIALAGVIGSRGNRSITWWQGEVVGRATDFGNSPEAGNPRVIEGNPASGLNDVDSLDGLFIAFSPWALGHLRFDTRHFKDWDGYDADICSQARALGKRVVTIELETLHGYKIGPQPLRSSYERANWMWKSKWLPAPWWRRIVWRIRAHQG